MSKQTKRLARILETLEKEQALHQASAAASYSKMSAISTAINLVKDEYKAAVREDGPDDATDE